MDENGTDEESQKKETKWTRDDKILLATFYCTTVIANMYYSIISPFFPVQAAEKGMSSFETGLVISISEVIITLTSPIFGAYLPKVGAKNQYIIGLVVASIASICFGLLEYCPGGDLFIAMCFLLRSIEALGITAFEIALFAIAANAFPDKIATVMGYLEVCIGLGLMLGPVVGGLLFKVGGFKMPFLGTALLNLIIAGSSICLIPNQKSLQNLKTSNMGQLLKIPAVLLMLFAVITGMACDSFLEMALGIQLNNVFHYGPAVTGAIYLIGPGLYAISCPVYGYIADERPSWSMPMMLAGSLTLGISFIFIGPAPFTHVANNHLWLLLLCVAVAAISLGPYVTSFQVMSMAAVEHGHEEDLQTFGLISGIYSMGNSIGTLIGPSLGGLLLDKVQFGWTYFIFGCFAFLYVLISTIYLFAASKCSKMSDKSGSREEDEKTVLVKKHIND